MARYIHGAAALLALGAGLAAAGCASDSQVADCPASQRVPNADRLVAFADGEQAPSARRFAARIDAMRMTCERVEGERGPALKADLALRLNTERGPALASPQVGYRYFVAVLDRDGRVVARRAFPVQLDFSGNATTLSTTDNVTQTIPLGQGGGPSDYTVYVGFELSEAQLRYNRENAG